MTNSKLRVSRLIALFSFLIPCGLPLVASAGPIQFYNSPSLSSLSRFTIGCGSATGDCSGQLEAFFSDSPMTWSSTNGRMLDGAKGTVKSETKFVNALLGIDLTASSGNIAPGKNDKNAFNFQLDADYFLIKLNGPTGQDFALLHNLGGALDLFFTSTNANAKLNHYITFASASVPEPGALGMFGLGALVAGAFVGLRRRQSGYSRSF